MRKRVCLRHGKNQVAVVYRIKNPVNCKIQLTPLINFRNYHNLSQSRFINFSTEMVDKTMHITPFNMEKTLLHALMENPLKIIVSFITWTMLMSMKEV